jgi:hypothetical protein
MGPRRKHRNRKRPGLEVRRRTAPHVKGKGADPTVFSEETPKGFAADAKLAEVACRGRGLPADIAQVGYDAGRRLLLQADIDAHGFGKVAGGLAAIAKVDIETGRYERGEATNTVNVNQQTAVSQQASLADLLAAEQSKIRSSYLPPVLHETLDDTPDSDGHASGE